MAFLLKCQFWAKNARFLIFEFYIFLNFSKNTLNLIFFEKASGMLDMRKQEQVVCLDMLKKHQGENESDLYL